MKLKKYRNIIFILLLFTVFSNTNSNSSVYNELYSKKNISNYFFGSVLLNNNENKKGIKYLKNIKDIKDIHAPYAKKLTIALVLDEKVQQAIRFVDNLQTENQNFFESNLLLGLNNLINKKYYLALNNFNKIIKNNDYYNLEKLVSYNLLIYQKTFEGKESEKINLSKKIPKNFSYVNNALLNCFLDNDKVDSSFLKLINSSEIDYTRYVFFYVNYLISKKRYKEALQLVENNTDKIDSNLLLDQTKIWLNKGDNKKITNLFDCKNPSHLVSELFYLIANLYASEDNYQISNFYLNLSSYFNSKFIFNKVLLAENFFNTKKYKKSKEIYENFNKKNNIYYWYSIKRISYIKSKLNNEKIAVEYFNQNFIKIKNPTLKNYYDAANFYKTFEKYNEAIKYYSKILVSLNEKHLLYSSILYRRAGSYERLKNWKDSDKDLLESLRLVPDDPYVLNYLAYSWLERNYNLQKSMQMLVAAHNLKPNDPYILDSIGWAYFLKGEYKKAEQYLQKAVKLMPKDPIVNDHYGDILWKLDKKIQATYFWNYVLNLEETEKIMKKKIKKKIIFGT